MNYQRISPALSAQITRQNKENLYQSRKLRSEVLLKRALRAQFVDLQFTAPDELVQAYLNLLETK